MSRDRTWSRSVIDSLRLAATMLAEGLDAVTGVRPLAPAVVDPE